MKDNRCFVCKYKQEDSVKVQEDVIYDNKGNAKYIPLCYCHSVELFKSGQKCFIMKYKDIFEGKIGIENDSELISYFTEIRHRAIW